MWLFYIGTCRIVCFALEKRLKLFFPRIKAYMHEARISDKVWLLLDYLNPVLNNVAQKERGVPSKNKQTCNLKV